MATSDALSAPATPLHDGALPLSRHLNDLRHGLIVSVASIAMFSAIAFYFIEPLMRHIIHPAGKLYFLGPAEALMVQLKVAFFTGIFASAPVLFFQVWRFIRAGLFPREKTAIVRLTMVSLALFFGGAVFCYIVVIPVSIPFLMTYGSDVLVPWLSATQYISFIVRMILAFGLAFELPLILWFLVWIGVLRSAALRTHRRLAVVLILLAAAVLTPTTDVFNQLLLAGPLLGLYEAGIIAARLSEKRREYGKNRIA